MTKKLLTLLVLLFLASEFSCTKTSIPPGTSALNIVNTMVGSTGLVTNFSGSLGSKTTDTFRYYAFAPQVYYGSANEISSYYGQTPLAISDFSDTTKVLLNVSLNLPINSIHTLFVTGSISSPDSLFTSDQVPYYPVSGDSVTGVRFVNLSTGSNPVRIDISGSSDTLLSGLAYKSISPFQPLPANAMSQANGYTLEFRDAISDSLLVTYSLNIFLFKSQTLAFYGSPASGLTVMSYNNF
jgi:hypothetical protein